MKSILLAIVALFVSIFGFGGHQAVTHSASNAAAAAATSRAPSAVVVAASSTSTAPVAGTTTSKAIVYQPIIERIIERAMPSASSGVTSSELDARLQDLTGKFSTQFAGIAAVNAAASNNFVTVPVFAQTQRIDNLSNVTISNATVHGVTGLSAGDIPSLSYLSSTGGTVTGTTTVTNFTINSILTDGLGSSGTTVQVLSSTGALTSWITPVQYQDRIYNDYSRNADTSGYVASQYVDTVQVQSGQTLKFRTAYSFTPLTASIVNGALVADHTFYAFGKVAPQDNYMGAEVSFTSTGVDASVGLILTNTNNDSVTIGNYNMIHAAWTGGVFSLHVIGPGSATILTGPSDLTASYSIQTDGTTKYKIGLWVLGNTVYALMPDGVVRQFTSPAVSTVSGPWAIWEIYGDPTLPSVKGNLKIYNLEAGPVTTQQQGLAAYSMRALTDDRSVPLVTVTSGYITGATNVTVGTSTAVSNLTVSGTDANLTLANLTAGSTWTWNSTNTGYLQLDSNQTSGIFSISPTGQTSFRTGTPLADFTVGTS